MLTARAVYFACASGLNVPAPRLILAAAATG
jgi:hypothetical protein